MRDTTAFAGTRRATSHALILVVSVLATVLVLSFSSFAVARASTPVAHASRSLHAQPAKMAPGTKKAVIVVGPVESLTSTYIQDATAMANMLKTAGAEVHLIVSPHATWAAVTAVANGADFFAYLGHGNGWPSPYAPYQEDTKDGMGLNPSDGVTSPVKYMGSCYLVGGINKDTSCTKGKNYGAGLHLAKNAVVLLNHLCYSAGNGEPGQATPSQSIAVQRVDNFAHGFLAAGARVVFALGLQKGTDLVNSLINGHATMDGFFEKSFGSNTDGSYPNYYGWVGQYPNLYFDSVRTSGARIHIDPFFDSKWVGKIFYGYERGVTGDLQFTTDEWQLVGDANDTVPPQVTSLSAAKSSTTIAAAGSPTVFTPNGDGISETVTIKDTLSENSYLEVSITNESGSVIQQFTAWAAAGAGSFTWNGTKASGAQVKDGLFKIKVTPRDVAGNVGDPASTTVLVLTALKAPAVTPGLFYPTDNDALAQTQTESATLTADASVTWKITDSAGKTVRTGMSDRALPAGTVSWTWNGKDDGGAAVPNGVYYSVATATTAAGSYSHSVPLRVMPFKVSSNTVTASVGQKVSLTIICAEPQKGWPTVYVKQPGLAKYRISAVKYNSTKFTTSFTMKSGGTPGTVTVTITGTDVNGGVDAQTLTYTLK